MYSATSGPRRMWFPASWGFCQETWRDKECSWCFIGDVCIYSATNRQPLWSRQIQETSSLIPYIPTREAASLLLFCCLNLRHFLSHLPWPLFFPLLLTMPSCTFLSHFQRQSSLCIVSPGYSYISKCACCAFFWEVCSCVGLSQSEVCVCLQDHLSIWVACPFASPPPHPPELVTAIRDRSVLLFVPISWQHIWSYWWCLCKSSLYVREHIPLGQQLPGYWWNPCCCFCVCVRVWLSLLLPKLI